MSVMTLYHGSSEIIMKPIYGTGKLYNDYGQGFYCTEHIELAKEWACTEGIDGYVNQYNLNAVNMEILNLSDDEYTILHWLALLVRYRQFRIATPIMQKGAKWLMDNFLIDLEKYDIIIGYRADDSYFAFARAFLNNEISLSQLAYAMRLGKLGEQVVLKSRKAFNAIHFVSYCPVDNSVYYLKRKVRDDEARAKYREELEKEDINGVFIRDIMREGMKADDLCLR